MSILFQNIYSLLYIIPRDLLLSSYLLDFSYLSIILFYYIHEEVVTDIRTRGALTSCYTIASQILTDLLNNLSRVNLLRPLICIKYLTEVCLASSLFQRNIFRWWSAEV